MFDLFELELQDLFKIRDCCVVLAKYNLHSKDLMAEVNKEIQEREGKFMENPDAERDIRED